VTTIIESARAPIGADASHSLTQPGSSSPLGATPASEGTNFSVCSKHATGVELLLFDCVGDAQAARVIRLDPAANRSYHYWHTSSPA
jgi:isoamylase